MRPVLAGHQVRLTHRQSCACKDSKDCKVVSTQCERMSEVTNIYKRAAATYASLLSLTDPIGRAVSALIPALLCDQRAATIRMRQSGIGLRRPYRFRSATSTDMKTENAGACTRKPQPFRAVEHSLGQKHLFFWLIRLPPREKKRHQTTGWCRIGAD